MVVAAAAGGPVPAIVCAALSFLLANWYFTRPFHRLHIQDTENVLALVIFLVVAGVVSTLVSKAARRAAEAARARAEAETLAALSGTMAAADDPLPLLVNQFRGAFGARGVAVLSPNGDGWKLEAGAGDEIPDSPREDDVTVPVLGPGVLVVREAKVTEDDVDVLRSFASQLALALEQRELRAHAARAVGLEEANELRTALLAAVSHDLRTPLSSIKASVSSLLQADVAFTDSARHELLETIDEGADRLNHLIGNLLDMSRLQTGALHLTIRDVGYDEVVPTALAGLNAAGRVQVEVPETLRPVRADAALLERTVANVVENALKWSPLDRPVRIEACEVHDRVELRISDQGPGIPVLERESVFQPFQRLDDRSNGTGVGLGLAVARGFVDAMDGSLTIEDTPGGGTTMIISLEAAPR